ncbi:MAG: cbb3-type cytochrome c oxidase subunit I [bacterium]
MSDRTANSALGGYLSAAVPGGWFATRDHKRIGLMFAAWTTGALLLGLMFGILPMVRSLGGMEDDAGGVLRALTYQRLILVFMFLAPAIPAVLGHFLLPLQLGARNLALPVFSLWSLRLYAAGLVLALASVLAGGVSFGWTMPTPLSLTGDGVFWLLAAGLACSGFSWFLVGVNIIVTVHHHRAPGLGFFRMPLLSWSLYLGAYLLVMSGLILAIIVLYLAGARGTGRGLFGPDSDPLLWLNYFWFATRPVVFFALVPAAGVVFDVVAGIGRKAVTGYRMVVGSMIALLALSVVTWGVHLSGYGQAPHLTFVFSVLSLLGAVPVALIAYSLLATLHRGAIACSAPTTFTVAFVLHAGIASVMGLFLASPALGAYLNTTMFATAQIDYVMWGGVLGAFLAGLHFWWPKMTGRPVNHPVGRFGAFLSLIGVNLAFFPQVIQGVGGAPVDVGALEPGPTGLTEIAALGWLFLVSGLIVAIGNLVGSLWVKEVAGDNPWGACTLEWTTASPPPVDNFAVRPAGGDPYGT